MKVNDAFPSKWLKTEDLKGKEVRVTISHVTREEVGEDLKSVVYFRNKQKGMVLNITKARDIGDFYGDEMDDWSGKDVILKPIRVRFKGQMTNGIGVSVPPDMPATRLAVPEGKERVTAKPQQPVAEKDALDEILDERATKSGIASIGAELDDEIPF